MSSYMGKIGELGAKVLVLNAGSSSLKFKVFSVNPFASGMTGLMERIGDAANSTFIAKGTTPTGETKKWTEHVPAEDHVSAMHKIMDFMKENVSPDIAKEVKAVGHRIVHGLEINQPVLLTDQAIDKIKEAAVLAPLHNPPGLQGIMAAKQVFKNVPQVGVFDTAFHQTMPAYSFMYGLPYELYTKHKIRRYGFHGTSHKYLVETAASMLGQPTKEANLITLHLGNGSSLAAIKNGQSIDTSMGMTPLEGLLMGTRSGDIDPAVPLFIQNRLGMSVKEVDTLLNKKAGLTGICGHNDLRSVIELRDKGDARGTLALDMFVYRTQKYIGAYMAALGGDVNALVFSAGIGENSSIIRDLICSKLKGLGIELDDTKNKETVGGRQGDIATAGSRVRVLVVPTDEELSIAKQTIEVIRKLSGGMQSLDF